MMAGRERLAVGGTAVVLAAALGVAGNDYVLSVLSFIGIFAVAVMGLVIVLGYAGQIVLGHAAFMGIGAYASAILTHRVGWAPPVGILAAGALAAAAAWVAGKPILRLRGFFLALATMAFAIIVDSVLIGWSSLTEGPSGMVGIPPFSIAGFKIVGEWPNLLFIAVVVLGALGITLTIERSMTGVALRALHRDEELAATLGVDVPSLKTAAFVLSAVYAGVAGACYAHYARFISPEIFGLHASFDLLLVAMLGGVFTPYGALIGAAILKFLPEALGAFRDYRLMAYGLVFILITFYFPDGVAGLARDLRARRRRATMSAGAVATIPLPRAAPRNERRGRTPAARPRGRVARVPGTASGRGGELRGTERSDHRADWTERRGQEHDRQHRVRTPPSGPRSRRLRGRRPDAARAVGHRARRGGAHLPERAPPRRPQRG